MPDKEKFQAAYESHRLYIQSSGKNGRRITTADLAHADPQRDLRGLDLVHADFKGAKLEDAALQNTNLAYADLRDANLACANLEGASLQSANLSGAYLTGANLYDANLHGADLHGAPLESTRFVNANLEGANLSGARLQNAILHGSDFRGADLTGANLTGADLTGSLLNQAKISPELDAQLKIIPEGEVIGWKKLEYSMIAKLLIPPEARRSNATGRKCRAELVQVLEITDKNGEPVLKGRSFYDSSFIYQVGKIVHPSRPFDQDRWSECASGIHFFLTREEAEKFRF
jgi:uncharacterized protein YjbI with pentapeptide repeats